MNKAWSVFIFLVICQSFCYGQFLTDPRAKTGFVKVETPLIIVNSLETDFNSFIIQPQNLKILKEYRLPNDLVAFGDKGKGGVIIAELKNKTMLLRLPEVLDYFKISTQNRKLKVMVNRALIHPDLFLADLNRIDKIEVIKQNVTDPVLYSFNKNEQYLNIVTRKD